MKASAGPVTVPSVWLVRALFYYYTSLRYAPASASRGHHYWSWDSKRSGCTNYGRLPGCVNQYLNE
eukprot:scaffold19697_cov55-Cyclotella_meneghiniana.AAC.2